jgi:hypothetical protein
MATLNFNANEVEPNSGFDPLPDGKYTAVITDSEMKSIKDNTGKYLRLEFTITEGQYKGRKVWDNLCLEHPKKQTVQIARGNLSAICRAVGVLEPQDSAQLHNLPLQITVRCKKREDNGDISNEVRGYAKKESNFGFPQQAASTDSTPPWMRN